MIELELGDGRGVSLRVLNQRLAYEGLLEGLPIRSMNERKVRQVVEQAELDFPRVPVTLIEPTARPIATSSPYPFGPPESLPPVICVGRFRSDRGTPRAEDGGTYSELVVVWFQDEFGPPLDAPVAKRIRELDWDSLAGDFGD